MNLNEHNHLVIMAGGKGSRFWPLSSEELPKQFLDVTGCGRTMLQSTLDRFAGDIPAQNIWVVTLVQYADIVRQQLPELQEANLLLEPCGRNTAPCICYVSWKIKKRDPKANIIVTPSDHYVENLAAFRSAITDALEFAAETDAMVTLGMKATRPETGYGYIKADLSYASSRRKTIYRVDGFTEKPDLEHAKEFYAQNSYFWNSGIFVWSVSTIVNAFRVYSPELSRTFEKLYDAYDTPEEQGLIDKAYQSCESISVDYAIMEKAEDFFVRPSDFGWSDLGSWNSLREQLPKDERGNAIVGDDIALYDTHNCIVHASGEKKVVVQGLDGYVVCEKDGTLLICKLTEEQRIKLFH